MTVLQVMNLGAEKPPRAGPPGRIESFEEYEAVLAERLRRDAEWGA